MIENTYKLSSKLWKEFSPNARQIFNSIMEQTLKNQLNIKHSNCPFIDMKHWDVICHNMAYIAACAADRYEVEIIK